MEKELFTPMDIDALGEMMNISLGSSATAVSNMLNYRVDITTPQVTIVDVANFSLGDLEPAMGVEIKYVSGLEGSNIMLLKRSDIKVIVDILMGIETPEEEFALNELTVSAVCELMNQMMGAASTALSDFLGRAVNISTPQPFELDDLERFKAEHFPRGADTVVVVRFSLKIENALESEFMNVMSVSLAKELLAGLGLDGEDSEDAPIGGESAAAPAPAGGEGKLSQEEIERLLRGAAEMDQEPSPAPAASPPQTPPPQPPAQEEAPQAIAQPVLQPAPQSVPAPQDAAPAPAAEAPYPNGYMGYPPMYYPPYPMPQPPQPKVIGTQPVEMPQMDAAAGLGKEQAENLDLILEVPLQVTVEIGRATRKVQDILEYCKGSLVILDKLAGDQVDLFVNGKCIARGDVVVIEDNFGVRITEIIQKPTLGSAPEK